MTRRNRFGNLLAAAAACLLFTGCAATIESGHPGEPTLDELVSSGARVLWIGAHPDDESFAGPILAKAASAGKGALMLVVLTRGESGACYVESGCGDDLGAWRTREMEEVARLYGAELRFFDYPNVGFADGGFAMRRDEIAADWTAHGSPDRVLAETIREFRPDVVLTFAPEFGATGHPEHQLASRFAMQAAVLAARPGVKIAGEPFSVSRFYWLLAAYWPYRMLRTGDPFTPTEAFVSKQACTPDATCAELAAEYTRPHRSQNKDMGSMRFAQSLAFRVYLRWVDPAAEDWPPAATPAD